MRHSWIIIPSRFATKALEEETLQIKRMRMITNLLSNIAHDYVNNTPIYYMGQLAIGQVKFHVVLGTLNDKYAACGATVDADSYIIMLDGRFLTNKMIFHEFLHGLTFGTNYDLFYTSDVNHEMTVRGLSQHIEYLSDIHEIVHHIYDVIESQSDWKPEETLAFQVHDKSLVTVHYNNSVYESQSKLLAFNR